LKLVLDAVAISAISPRRSWKQATAECCCTTALVRQASSTMMRRQRLQLRDQDGQQQAATTQIISAAATRVVDCTGAWGGRKALGVDHGRFRCRMRLLGKFRSCGYQLQLRSKEHQLQQKLLWWRPVAAARPRSRVSCRGAAPSCRQAAAAADRLNHRRGVMQRRL
jgi:hypothetical protein